MTVIFITHDMGVVSQIADRIVVMQKGKIVEEITPYPFFMNLFMITLKDL
jgi:ABC-type dipeptide/oligopeptide/nickel transport system ATPase component